MPDTLTHSVPPATHRTPPIRFAAFRERLAIAVLGLLGARLATAPELLPVRQATQVAPLALEALSLAEVETRLAARDTDPALYLLRGGYRFAAGEYAKADDDYSSGIARSAAPRLNSRLYSGRAVVRLSVLDTDGAHSDCEAARTLDPDNAEAAQIYGLICAEKKDLRGAETAFGEVLRLQPDAARSVSNFAWLRLLHKDTDVALRLAEDALGRDPQDATACYVRGLIHAGRKQRTVAVNDYRAALASWPHIHSPHTQHYFDEMTAYIDRWTDSETQ